MDDFISVVIAILLFVGVCGLLGIVGFFRAGRAMREVRALQAVVAGLTAAGVALPAAVPAPFMAPPGEPEAAPVVPVARPAPVQLPVGTPPPPRRDWEALITAKWGVWLGSAALLLAGVFLVRYASDQGLLGPPLRCAAAVALAVALMAAGEWLQRRSPGASGLVDYAPGALAAGGVAILFAAAYMAGPLYGLVPAPVAFVLLAAAALSGLALSLRMGQLVAAVGIVGAFVTPLLVQDGAPSLPGLFAYLLFVAAAALAVVRYSAWVWLGWATTIACAGFVLVVVLGGDGRQAWAPALFVPAAGLLALALLPGAALDQPVGRRLAYVPIAALGGAGLLLSYAVPETATHAGVLLLAAVVTGKAALEARLSRLSWLAGLLFLLLIGGWGLPPWRPSGEAITAGDAVIAVLPGAWAPDALQPLLLTAAAGAAAFFAAGLWGERRRPFPLHWSALASALPVLSLILLYARVTAFQPSDIWAGAAVALAGIATAAAAAAAKQGGADRAAVHAAGAVAALALGCAAVLSAQWLTVAIALFLPALASIEQRADVPGLRWVGLAVGLVAASRLLLNPAVLDYGTGQTAVMASLLPPYGIAAASFALAARMFRRRADDGVVAALELGSAAFVAAFTMLMVRNWATGGRLDDANPTFLEAGMQVSALAVLSLLAFRLQRRTGRPMLGWAGRVSGAAALTGGVLLILLNPAFISLAEVGPQSVLNALLPAYLIPALAAALALREPAVPGPSRPVLLWYALAAFFVFVTLTIRQGFHPGAIGLGDSEIVDAELWAWSGAWLAFGLGLMALGIVTGRKPLRLAALAVVAVTGAKIFLVDMSGLAGLWRVLSFLGLGLTLIGLGAAYRRFVATPQEAAP